MTPLTVLLPAIVLAVAVLLVGEFRKIDRIIWIFKPLSTALIVLLAALPIFGGSERLYGLWICVGLVLCLGGDVALMPPDKPVKFRTGLVLFLLGHMAYIVAFWAPSGFATADIVSGAVLLILSVLFYRHLSGGLGSLRLPVIAYMAVIGLMVNRALSMVAAGGGRRAFLAAAGALAFFVSDLMLAGSRFRWHWRGERVSLVFYFGGQVLIALSTGY